MTVTTGARTAPFDLVVVGSGIAGLCAVLTALEHAGEGVRVALITKGAVDEGCTPWAQGGLAAAVGPDDAPALHFADTVAAGRGLCDEAAVRVLTDEAPRAVECLLGWGVPFDRGDDGAVAVSLEAAHGRARIVHSGGDSTGAAIERTLASRVATRRVTILDHSTATALLLDGARCVGVRVRRPDGDDGAVLASATVLASGGAGRLWRNTTNPAQATGEGVALAFLAGAEVSGMEFVQFHPTALAVAGAPRSLISEAVRGAGAHVVDEAGHRFLFDTDSRGELAARDVVSQAINTELQRSRRPNVWLDATAIERVAERFPTVTASCRAYGIDPQVERIPIAPAAHYLIGGVRTDLDGATSVPGLYAAGEVASTGVHGANRLASNSLLEGVVFGRRAAVAALRRHGEDPAPGHYAITPAVPGPRRDEAALTMGLRTAMWDGVGIARDADSLAAARAVIDHVLEETQAADPGAAAPLYGAALTASLVCEAATLRTESRGAHVRRDHPDSTDAWHGQLVMHRDRGAHLDGHA